MPWLYVHGISWDEVAAREAIISELVELNLCDAVGVSVVAFGPMVGDVDSLVIAENWRRCFWNSILRVKGNR